MREPDPRIVLGLHRSRYERRSLAAALDLGVRAIDTAFNYRGFSAHRTLANFGDLLSEVSVSTKVGYFPGQGGAVHSLDAGRLRDALEQTNQDLGRAPDLVFLHNPERSLAQLDSQQARDSLTQACAVLVNAATEGLCGAWGLTSWHPAPLLGLVGSDSPRPDVLMIRCGLLVGIGTLDAAEALAERWSLPTDAVWGMSPFGGRAADPVWGAFDPRVFLRPGGARCSPIQAVFRAAYRLPRVSRVAVGADDPSHLHELVSSLDAEVDEETVTRYRVLLRAQRAANSLNSRSASVRTGASSGT